MNKNRTLYAACFLLGLFSGALAAYDRTRNHYEKIVQKEIEQVKQHYAAYKEETTELPEENIASTMPEQAGEPDLKRQLHQLQYGSPSEQQDKEHPYVITPNEFGEWEDYTLITLTYYSDGVLTDENDQKVEDVDNTVGSDAANHFGEYEDDAVYIRNDRLKSDFEILRDYRTYADIVAGKPYLTGD